MTYQPKFLPLLTYIIGMYDPYGVSHSTRVATLAVSLAKKSGVHDTTLLEEIHLAGQLHDIGKIGIPESIRRLPGKYLPVERMLMEQHSVIGERILEQVANGTISETVRKTVRHHHENWNGTGYPDRLMGKAIPLGARIIRICDFYDARTHVRGYDVSMEESDAIRVMVMEQEDSAWADPALLLMFIEMVGYDG